MLNRVVLIGRLATDPELKYTPSGLAVTTFRLAVDRNRTNAQGEKETDFISIVAWKQSAEFAANYLTKGRLVAVDGRLQIRSWVAQDGTRRVRLQPGWRKPASTRFWSGDEYRVESNLRRD